MLKRVCLLSVLALSLSACSSVPNEYAFWRENDTQEPNLADVPAPPNTQDAKAEMDAMRNRLEQDRNQAYLAAQGVIPMEDVNATTSQNPPHMEPMLGGDEMAPTSVPGISQQEAPPVEYQYPLTSGTVQYNYTANPNQQEYVYGNSPVQIARQGGVQAQAVQAIQTANESISIDFSALDASMDTPAPTTPVSAPGVSGVPLVFFKHGSATLDAHDRAAIKQLADNLKQEPKSVVIAGHASPRTGLKNVLASRDVNLRMSAKRANAVMKELAKYGVSAEQIFIAAYGDSFPNTTKEMGLDQEAADRRVEILFDR